MRYDDFEVKSGHYTGTFLVNGEEFHGMIVYSRESGSISLDLEKELDLDYQDDAPDSYTSVEMKKTFDRVNAISGKLDAGFPVTLFDCHCTDNTISLGDKSRHLRFKADYWVWNDCQAVQRKYSKFVCVVENGLRWGDMSQIQYGRGIRWLKFTSLENIPCYNWYNAKITFSTNLDNNRFSIQQEVTTIVERLQFEIEANENKSIGFFLDVRDKVMAMISYAIKDNLNISSQWQIHGTGCEETGLSCRPSAD